VLDDLLRLDRGRPVLVDDFRSRPSDLAPLLSSAAHAVFLLGAPGFRERALRRRYSDRGRARANWGDLDVEDVLVRRLARDQPWHDEIARQAQQYQLPVVIADGSQSAGENRGRACSTFRASPPQPPVMPQAGY